MSLDMEFPTKDRKKESKGLSGTFHDADIEDEMILGYPWVTLHELAIIWERCKQTTERARY